MSVMASTTVTKYLHPRVIFVILALVSTGYFIAYASGPPVNDAIDIQRLLSFVRERMRPRTTPIVKAVEYLSKPELVSLINVLHFVMNLISHEHKVYSQNNEDGIIQGIFNYIGVKDKTFVEFGVESGIQCNTRLLRERYGWTGLMMDGGFQNLTINLHKHMIFPHNIVQLFRHYKIKKEFDLLSVDTDFKDFWLLKNILEAGYRPRVIIHEYNSFLGPVNSLTVPLNWNQSRWDGKSQYFGFSVTAGWHLSRYYGYSMVYCEQMGINCMWVVDGERGFGPGIVISDYVNGSALWKPPNGLHHTPDTKNRPWTIVPANMKFQ